MRLFILAIGIASIFAVTPVFSAQRIEQERTEWIDILVDNANDVDTPRVLLAGDSIVLGYYFQVGKLLSGQANVARYTTSKFLGDPDYLAGLSLILRRYKIDVVHINNGLHGTAHTEREYKEGLHALLKTIHHLAPRAKLIWCLTTPVRTQNNLAQLSSNRNQQVIDRNRIATEVMTQNSIPIDNLYDEVKDHPEYYESDGIHFNYKGKTAQANKVSEAIKRYALNKVDLSSGK